LDRGVKEVARKAGTRISKKGEWKEGIGAAIYTPGRCLCGGNEWPEEG